MNVSPGERKLRENAAVSAQVYTELAPRPQQFHVAPAMQQPNSGVSTPLRWIKQKQTKTHAIKGYSDSFRIACDMSAVSLLESRE